MPRQTEQARLTSDGAPMTLHSCHNSVLSICHEQKTHPPSGLAALYQKNNTSSNWFNVGFNVKQMSLKLTEEQTEKLRKLDKEMKKRAEDEAKHALMSSSTGIPRNIVGFDVIKLGTLLGLIKKDEAASPGPAGRDGAPAGSLIKLLLGDDETPPPARPMGFHQPPHIIKEEEKLAYHRSFVQEQSRHISKLVSETIDFELETINKQVSVNLEEHTLDCFKTVLLETVEALLDLITDNPNDPDLWKSLTVTRNSLLGALNVCEYKNLVRTHALHILARVPRSQTKITQHLSSVDRLLSLFNGSVKLPSLSEPSQAVTRRCLTELTIRAFTNPPELRPFVFEDVAKQICIPSLMILPIEYVVDKCLVGPFRNNPVGFLFDTTGPEGEARGDFYILKTINPDGGRVWILDAGLERFTKRTISVLTAYLITIFRTLYKACFDDNTFFEPAVTAPAPAHPPSSRQIKRKKPKSEKRASGAEFASEKSFEKSSERSSERSSEKSSERRARLVSGCPQEAAFRMLIRNITAVSDWNAFYKLLTLVLKSKSPLFPTDRDFFNFIKSKYDRRPPFIPVFYSVEKTSLTNFSLMFDEESPMGAAASFTEAQQAAILSFAMGTL